MSGRFDRGDFTVVCLSGPQSNHENVRLMLRHLASSPRFISQKFSFNENFNVITLLVIGVECPKSDRFKLQSF